ncbi:MAG: TlpA family protein disulfide reductase [Candidatus Methylumidiphilus sp.]
MKKILWVFAALLAMASGVIFQRELNSAPVGKSDLEMAFPDLTGKPHHLSDWKGKVLIVNFWATWCPPCLEEMPEFVKLQNEFGPKGLQFIGILTDDEALDAQAFLKAKPVNYPILDGTIGARQWTEKLGDKAGVLPISVVFDPSGNRVHTELGIFTRNEIMEKVKPWIK